jgi:lipoprotein-anchoring transpeptidase ErfK/SrfK
VAPAPAPVAPHVPQIAAPHVVPQAHWLQAAAVALGLVGLVVVAAQLVVTSWFAGRVYPGVTVAGVSVGGMTYHQARDRLAGKLEDYKVSLRVGEKSYEATPAEAGITYDLEATVQQAYVQGRNEWYAPLGLLQINRHTQSLAYAYSVDQPRQRQYVEQIVAASGQAPVDASVVVQDGVPTVQPDQKGYALSAAEVAAALEQQVASVQVEQVTLKPSIQVARIQGADVKPAIEQTKRLLAVPITITYQGQSFRPTAAQMGEWVAYDKSPPDQPAGLTPKPNPDGIKHYLQTVALKINVNPVNRKVRIENGVSSEERAGVEGLQLDQESLAKQIADAFGGQQALTVEAPTKKVPFQTETNRVVTLQYGKYIEINLKSQHMWVYQDQKVIYESPITSGATGAGFPTVQGLFSIQAKQTNRNLNGYAIGYNYNVFVKYWMPFFGNYGMHDASWRSSFGGPDYYYGGSHGCVNMPEGAAAFLYGWADVGTPVWVHS